MLQVNHVGKYAVPPLGLAVLCKGLRLLRTMLRFGAMTEKLAGPYGGMLHLALAGRELSIMLVRELQILSQVQGEAAASSGAMGDQVVAQSELLVQATKLSPTMHALSQSVRPKHAAAAAAAADQAVAAQPGGGGASPADELRTFKARDIWATVHDLQLSVCTMVLAHSPNPAKLLRTTDSMGRTPLHLAARGSNLEILGLLDFGEPGVLLAPDRFGRSFLHLAAIWNAGASKTRVQRLIAQVEARHPAELVERLLEMRDDTERKYSDYLKYSAENLQAHAVTRRMVGAKAKRLEAVAGARAKGVGATNARSVEAQAELRAALETLPVKALRARAKSSGASVGQLEEAADIDDQKPVLVSLLLELEGGSTGAVGGGRESGGWDTAQLGGGWAKERCDIDAVEGMLDAQRFLRDFLKPGRPVLMRGAAKDWPWSQTWTKRNFLMTHGSRTFTVGDIPYPKIFGLPNKELSAREYGAQ